jgi:glycosyltransferase involved in cell wall biosynthesis
MIFVMDLPKPIHGMSNVNLAVLNAAEEAGLKPKVINTVPSYASRFFSTKLWGGIKVGHTFMCYISLFSKLLFNSRGVVYRPINGGNGQVYDLGYILFCRLFLNKIYIHHHSFNYLNNRSFLFSTLNKLAGNTATHIVLGERMGLLLSEHYGIDKSKIQIVSNLAFFEAQIETETINDVNKYRLGHLANLCTEKGVDIFIDVCRILQTFDIDFSAKIAGPFVDDIAKNIVLNAVNEIPQIEYVGPLYAEHKSDFYSKLDCFIFPSKYKNEAEPLVLYEAALTGAFLIGTRRGCMQDVIHQLLGFTTEENIDIANNIAKAIKLEIETQGVKNEEKAKRLTCFRNKQGKAKESLTYFIEEMSHYELSKS